MSTDTTRRELPSVKEGPASQGEGIPARLPGVSAWAVHLFEKQCSCFCFCFCFGRGHCYICLVCVKPCPKSKFVRLSQNKQQKPITGSPDKMLQKETKKKSKRQIQSYLLLCFLKHFECSRKYASSIKTGQLPQACSTPTNVNVAAADSALAGRRPPHPALLGGQVLRQRGRTQVTVHRTHKRAFASASGCLFRTTPGDRGLPAVRFGPTAGHDARPRGRSRWLRAWHRGAPR